jgi:hypothetical protein
MGILSGEAADIKLPRSSAFLFVGGGRRRRSRCLGEYMIGAIIFVVLIMLVIGCSYCVINIIRLPVITVWIVILMIGSIICCIVCIGIALNRLGFFIIKRIILLWLIISLVKDVVIVAGVKYMLYSIVIGLLIRVGVGC